MNYSRTINIEGPAGNAFNLMATAKSMAKDIGENGKKITNEMKESGDYDTLVQTFLFYFGDYVDLVDNYGDSVKERYINE
jgi:hypothetical protein